MGLPVTIDNYGSSTLLGTYMQMYNTNQTNHGKWFQTYVDMMTGWQEHQTNRQAEWLKVYYGWEDNTYDKNPETGGGVYGDARRSEEKWRKIQLAIATLQQLASFYFADKQYQAAKEAREHQISVWETEKEWAERYQNAWFKKYYPLELKLLNNIKSRLEDDEYAKPHYDVAQSRATVVVRSEFANAREQVRKCFDPRCIGASCHSLKSLAIEEAKAITGAVEKGYRAEEARADTKEAGLREEAFSLVKLGRGLADASLGALNSASQAAKIASTYNPYQGWQESVGNGLGYWHNFANTTSTTSGSQANMLNRQAQGYMMTQGSLSSPSDMLIKGTKDRAVTGTNGFNDTGMGHSYYKTMPDSSYKNGYEFIVDGGLG